MLVNPVRIVYISDTALCITDPDGDGLYYYNYYDRSLESVCNRLGQLRQIFTPSR